MPRYQRQLAAPGEDPFETVTWERRTARITGTDGHVVFEQKHVEVPAGWSGLATDLVASRYFAGIQGTPAREGSVRDLVGRVVRSIAAFARADGLVGGAQGARDFEADLAHLLLHQKAAFNSPVWFNVGLDRKPQASACFILGLEDRLDSILSLAQIEGRIFSKGSGAGTNFSALRGSKEPMSSGGYASGPVAFLRGLDALAGAVKSGGRTRRAAKMALLDADHPDVLEFVRCKAREEERAPAIADEVRQAAAEMELPAELGGIESLSDVMASVGRLSKALNEEIKRLQAGDRQQAAAQKAREREGLRAQAEREEADEWDRLARILLLAS